MKLLPLISFDDFKNAAFKVKKFKSIPRLKTYEIVSIDADIIYFIRKDANSTKLWTLDLKSIYKAYIELEDFQTLSFRKYVPVRHSPARGLLMHLGLLMVQNKY